MSTWHPGMIRPQRDRGLNTQLNYQQNGSEQVSGSSTRRKLRDLFKSTPSSEFRDASVSMPGLFESRRGLFGRNETVLSSGTENNYANMTIEKQRVFGIWSKRKVDIKPHKPESLQPHPISSHPSDYADVNATNTSTPRNVPGYQSKTRLDHYRMPPLGGGGAQDSNRVDSQQQHAEAPSPTALYPQNPIPTRSSDNIQNGASHLPSAGRPEHLAQQLPHENASTTPVAAFFRRPNSLRAPASKVGVEKIWYRDPDLNKPPSRVQINEITHGTSQDRDTAQQDTQRENDPIHPTRPSSMLNNVVIQIDEPDPIQDRSDGERRPRSAPGSAPARPARPDERGSLLDISPYNEVGNKLESVPKVAQEEGKPF